MRKFEFYKQIYEDFKILCADGQQSCSFASYCRERGVDFRKVRQVQRDLGFDVRSIPGYKFIPKKQQRGIGQRCIKVYEGFKKLCVEGNQPSSFAAYCESFGVTQDQMREFQKKNNIRIADLPGYVCMTYSEGPRVDEVPFEDVIFEEAGFLPVDTRMITVTVNEHVAVGFPSDTDVSVIAKFVKKLGKEASNVGA